MFPVYLDLSAVLVILEDPREDLIHIFGFSSPTEFSIDFQSVNWYQHYAYYGMHDITLYTLGADHGTLVVDECYTRCR